MSINLERPYAVASFDISAPLALGPTLRIDAPMLPLIARDPPALAQATPAVAVITQPPQNIDVVTTSTPQGIELPIAIPSPLNLDTPLVPTTGTIQEV